VVRPEITTCDIYRAIMAFVAMQLLARVLVFAFTGLVTWLPKAIGW
jgi:TRAP-type mannitol/chloroaromatic compound transport system permease large subunit